MDATVIAAVISVLGVGFLGLLGYFLQGIRSEIRDLRTDIRDLRTDMRAEIDELRSAIHQLDIRLTRVEELLRQQVQRIDELDTRLTRVEDLVGEGAAAPVPA